MFSVLKLALINLVYIVPVVCQVQSSVGVFIQGEYLYWQAHLGGLESDFGSSAIIVNNTDSVSITNAKENNIDPHFGWTSGFRIGAGIIFIPSSLELSVNWTDFKNKGDTNKKGDYGVRNAGMCKISLNQIDTILAYRHTYRSVNIKSFLGIRASEIKEDVNAQVFTPITIVPATLAMETRHFDDQQYFKGLGPIFGLSVILQRFSGR